MWYLQEISSPFQCNPYYICDGYFNDEEIDQLVNFIETHEELKPGEVVNEKNYNHIRDSNINFLDFERYELLYRKCTDIVNEINNKFFHYKLSFIETLQYTVYRGEQYGHYNWHVDQMMGGETAFEMRKLSFVVALTNPTDYEGGDFIIKNSAEEINLKSQLTKGSIIFFPSPVLHKVDKVTRGVRKSLVGWVKGPSWS